MIHSILLLVSLETFFVFESPCGLAFLNNETVQQLLPLGNFPGGIESSGRCGSTGYMFGGCWRRLLRWHSNVHHLVFNSYQCRRIKEGSCASTLLQFAELTEEHPSEVRHWSQREMTTGLDRALDLGDCRCLFGVFINHGTGCTEQLVKPDWDSSEYFPEGQ